MRRILALLTGSVVAVGVLAAGPTGFAVGIAASWNTELDHTGQSGGANTTYWTSSNEATLVVLLPKDSYGVISWQSTEAGYGYTGQKRPPLSANRCP